MTCYVGLDVSMEETAFCVRGPEGRILGQGKVATDPEAIVGALARFGHPERVVLETGRMANWLHRQLVARDLPAVCVDARQAHAVLSQMPNKTDANDAAMLAELARTGFYRAVRVKSEASQAMRALLKARNLVLGQRMDLDNTIRGLVTSMGVRLPKGPRRWSDRVELALEANEALALALRLLLRLDLARSLLELTRRLLAEARNSGLCRRLMTVPGVGAITAYAFVATVDDPTRFAHSRSVGAYVGLTSRRYQSGEINYSGRITRRGDGLLRTLLFEAASSLITRAGGGGALREWALRAAR
ncbi:IS110 family RNA-guided transposase [Muricoccus pecuniae]|uniref:Transposase n=1 Tax=Muricoccus pecuniae TaxID=693023 RepID=A0A840YBF2_9PROT|nr:IS110 family transposase [Roseomonas pecuniae]MBB5696039.1 transposase [Roseomonas pecuniae]